MKNILIMRLSMERKIIRQIKKLLVKVSDIITNYCTKKKNKIIKISDALYASHDYDCIKECVKLWENAGIISDLEIDLLKVILNYLKSLDKIDKQICKSINDYK